VITLSGRLPDDGSTWSATGIGCSFLPVITTALAAGGHVRCGFEDQVEIAPGEPAGGNAALVERVVSIAALLGRAPASPGRARELLRLS
jgi:3-keto-5-aminohexanoate cleavage enzyme